MRAWKKQTKNFVLISNSKKYQPNLYGEEMVQLYIDYFEQYNVVDKHFVYKLQQNNANSEESILGLGFTPSNQKTWFDFKSGRPEEIIQYSDDSHLATQLFSVEFKLDREVVYHNRSIVNVLDVLGDIGGLFEAMKGISSIIVILYTSIFGYPINEYLLQNSFIKNPEQLD